MRVAQKAIAPDLLLLTESITKHTLDGQASITTHLKITN